MNNDRRIEMVWSTFKYGLFDIYAQSLGRSSIAGVNWTQLLDISGEIERLSDNDKAYRLLESAITSCVEGMAEYAEARPIGISFLEKLDEVWTGHQDAMRCISNVCPTLDETIQIGMDLWRDHMIRSSKIQAKIRDSLVMVLEQDLSGEDRHRKKLKAFITMLRMLGQNVYEDVFEKPYYEMSAKFYKAEAQKLVDCPDCGDNLAKLEFLQNEEIERRVVYLANKPRTPRAVKQVITENMPRLVHSGLGKMLSEGRCQHLRAMYRLFHPVANGLETMRKTVITYFNDNLVSTPSKDPLVFIQRLLDVLTEKERLDEVLKTAFENDKVFENVCEASFKDIINQNPRSPEFLSLFVDEKLCSTEDTDTILEKAIRLFRYLDEKDVFEKYFRQHMTKRLLSEKHVTVSYDAVRKFIENLKTECGEMFTSNLEAMLSDMKKSQDFYAAFGPNSLEARVLTTGVWPIQTCTEVCKLPDELSEILNKFETCYHGSNRGRRRLTWLTHLGNAVLTATFGNGQKLELNVSTHQMCVLMLFNSADRLTFEEISRATEIPSITLKTCLQSLSCVDGKKLLLKEEDSFALNSEFTSKSSKVNLNSAALPMDSEPEKILERVAGDRKPQIDAAIVRSAKSRKVVEHTILIKVVTSQLRSQFLVNLKAIEARIESLIERGYLERIVLAQNTAITFYKYIE